MLSMISKITRKGFLTTVKDYKNMYANQRYFEEPFVLRTDKGDAIVILKREWDSDPPAPDTAKLYNPVKNLLCANPHVGVLCILAN